MRKSLFALAAVRIIGLDAQRDQHRCLIGLSRRRRHSLRQMEHIIAGRRIGDADPPRPGRGMGREQQPGREIDLHDVVQGLKARDLTAPLVLPMPRGPRRRLPPTAAADRHQAARDSAWV